MSLDTIDPLVAHARRFYRSLGIPLEGYEAYRSHLNSAKRRNIPFLFSIKDWWEWWQVDNRWDRRGMGKDKLVMARNGDAGPYSPDNVRCITHVENLKEIPAERRSLGHKEAWARMDPEKRAAFHLCQKGEAHPRSRPVVTPDGRFGNATEAAAKYGITRQQAAKRARMGMYGWAFEADLFTEKAHNSVASQEEIRH